MLIEEAANRLGCTKRSVHNYINRGFVRRVVRDGKTCVQREDVEQLALDKGTDFPAMSRKTMHELNHRIRKLEEQMALVQEAWGIQEKPLRPSEKEAAGLYKAATDYLSVAGWKAHELETWANLFNQFDEKTLEALADAMKDSQPWKVFFELSSRMLEFITNAKGAKESLQLQALRAKMEMGKKKVRESALFWIESGRGTVSAHIFKALDSPKEDLLRALAKPGSKSI
jgi:hypothetical protein